MVTWSTLLLYNNTMLTQGCKMSRCEFIFMHVYLIQSRELGMTSFQLYKRSSNILTCTLKQVLLTVQYQQCHPLFHHHYSHLHLLLRQLLLIIDHYRPSWTRHHHLHLLLQRHKNAISVHLHQLEHHHYLPIHCHSFHTLTIAEERMQSLWYLNMKRLIVAYSHLLFQSVSICCVDTRSKDTHSSSSICKDTNPATPALVQL